MRHTLIAALLAGHPVSRAEYDALVASGQLEGQAVELIRGRIVPMSPQGDEHAHLCAVLVRILTVALLGKALVRAHSPLIVGADSVPEPDISVVDEAESASGCPASAHLVIEVSQTSLEHASLEHDRTTRASLYAGAGVPEYWIVDLESRRIERRTECETGPDGDRYARLALHALDATLTPVAFPDAPLDLTALAG